MNILQTCSDPIAQDISEKVQLNIVTLEESQN